MIRKIILILVFPLMVNVLFAQHKEEALKLIDKGVACHDLGDYYGAIARYDKALERDKDNLLALTEKAFSLLSLQEYDQVIKCCQLAIEKHPGDIGLKRIYVTYGNAFDGLKMTDKALEIYDIGIKLFPRVYQLYFSKGVTLSGLQKYDEAILCFQKSVTLNPEHADSHQAMARILNMKNKRIPAVLAYCRFLVIEPNNVQAKEDLMSLQKLMKGKAEDAANKSMNFNTNMPGDTTLKRKPEENNFDVADLKLTADAAQDYDIKNKYKTEVEQFIRKFENLCASLKQTQKDNDGFYWSYYVPYYMEMQDKKFIKTFAYISFAPSDDPLVLEWAKSHKAEIDKFYLWSKEFIWKANL